MGSMGFWNMRAMAADPKSGQTLLKGFSVPRTVRVILGGTNDDIPGHKWPDISIKFEVSNGAIACSELRIASGPNDRPIRSADLTVLNLDALGELVFQRFAAPVQVHADGSIAVGAPGEGNSFQPVHAGVEETYREPHAELLAVARIYLDPASRSAPTRSVLDVLQYGSRETASRRIKAAREKGLIPPAGATDQELDAAWEALQTKPDTPDTPERAAERRRKLDEHLGRNSDAKAQK